MADAVPLSLRARGQGTYMPLAKPASKPDLQSAKLAKPAKPDLQSAKLAKPDSQTAKPAQSARPNLRQLITLFCIFLIAVSDFFTNNVIAKCGKKTMQGRYPSAWGVVLQGIFIVVSFALISYINKYEEIA